MSQSWQIMEIKLSQPSRTWAGFCIHVAKTHARSKRAVCQGWAELWDVWIQRCCLISSPYFFFSDWYQSKIFRSLKGRKMQMCSLSAGIGLWYSIHNQHSFPIAKGKFWGYGVVEKQFLNVKLCSLSRCWQSQNC